MISSREKKLYLSVIDVLLSALMQVDGRQRGMLRRRVIVESSVGRMDSIIPPKRLQCSVSTSTNVRGPNGAIAHV
jgi:hypothetical protein